MTRVTDFTTKHSTECNQ